MQIIQLLPCVEQNNIDMALLQSLATWTEAGL